MKKLIFSVFTFVIGSVAFAQPDSTQTNSQARTITFFINDQAFIGSISGLDPNEIERIEVDKTIGDAIRIYTKKDVRRRFVALDRYLRQQFKGYGKDGHAAVVANGVVVDVPAEAILMPKAVLSVSRTFTPDGEVTYRVETINDMGKEPRKGGIRVRGTASNERSTEQPVPEKQEMGWPPVKIFPKFG